MAGSQPTPVNPQPGDVLAGKYRIERVLGAGGMGVVVAAHHLQLDERVALKFLLPSALMSPEAVSRFVREARAAAKIKNEHVARVTDVGELDNGSPYMVMEYLEGADLGVWLQRHGALPVAQAVDFVLQACEALAEAHALGIVHRDLKPANLFCLQKPDGSVCIKVLDFGISKVIDAVGSTSDMTRTTAFLGSPLYMSPEQMQASKGVDIRSDIWSLGVILFELVTGRPPFDARVVTELIIKIATEPAPPLRQLRQDAPVALEAVLATCLEKDRALRFQTVGQLAVALQRFGSARGRMSTEGILGTLGRAGMSPGVPGPGGDGERSASAVSAASHTSASWGNTTPDPRSGGKVVAVIAVGVGLLALGFIAVLGLQKRNATTAIVVAAEAPSPVASSPTASPAEPADSSPKMMPMPPPPAAIAPQIAPAPQPRAPSPHRTTSPTAPQAPTAAPAPAPNPNCDPPFSLDSQGRKLFKPECYLNR